MSTDAGAWTEENSFRAGIKYHCVDRWPVHHTTFPSIRMNVLSFVNQLRRISYEPCHLYYRPRRCSDRNSVFPWLAIKDRCRIVGAFAPALAEPVRKVNIYWFEHVIVIEAVAQH